MKTAKEWIDELPQRHTSCAYVEESDIEAIQADARAEGRREGLEEAAKVCEDEKDSAYEVAGPLEAGSYGHLKAWGYAEGAEGCASLIRKLLEAPCSPSK